MRKLYSLAILSLMWLAGMSAQADDHGYVNGLCTMHDDCDAPFEAPEIDVDGFYMLTNAGNVEWISQQVSNNNIDLNCKLMNDIDFENKENLHSPIGPTDGRKYNGTFDGQGHRIKNMIINRPDTERQGFFGDLRGNPNTRGEGTVVKNLIIDKSCSITGGLRTGGITGTGQNNAKEIVIMNCVNEATIISPSRNCGGITGGSTSNHPIWKISNCVNTGHIICTNASPEAAGISGWLGDNANTRVVNCLNIGLVDNGEGGTGVDASGRGVFRHSQNASVGINCYDLSGNEFSTQYIEHDFTPEDVVSGRVTFVVNQKAGENVFFQTLGTDEYPLPFSTSKVVYLQGEIMCDGTPIEGGTYTNDPVEPVRPPHEYAEGDYHCINCGKIADDFCEIIDGFYQLNNERDVCWFAEFVKEGNVEVNAKLNADLDFTEYPDFAGIADLNHGFKGIFDGGFHTISNMDMSWREEEEWVGFINFLNGGATVKNLRGDATCIISALGNAGFIGGSTAAGDIFLENIGFEGDVSCQRAGAGGVLGCNTGSQAHIYMTNCYSTGFISGALVAENGALSAWLGSSGAVITNCWSSATVSGVQNNDKYLARFDKATFNNCYSVNGTPLQCTLIEPDAVESGELCYKLNGDQSSISFYQNLGSDEFPTFLPGHKQVYVQTEMRCDGWYDATDATYTNDPNASVRPNHQYQDGFCKVCGQQDPDFPFLDVFANADHDVTTGYETRNGGDGSNLGFESSVVEHWNSHWFESWQTITGLEPGVYRLRVQGLQRAAQWSDSQGAAYETGTLGEAYAPLYHSSQYFAEVNGQKIAARFLDIAEGGQEERVGETENYSDQTGKWVPNSRTACRKYFERGLYWNTPLYFAIENEADSVRVGVENSLYLYGNWTVWDSWRLDKISDGDVTLIRQQQEAAIQHDIEELLPQVSLMKAYDEAKEAIENATTLADIMAASDVLARNPNLIRRSHLAYIDFKTAIEAIRSEREGRDDLNGAATDLLDRYLNDDEEASEELPNGTFISILDARTLSEEELQAEILFAKSLYENAIMTSISVGSDVSNIIKNPAFDEDGNFKDWDAVKSYESPSGSNFSSNTGFTDIYPVAGTWNTAFTVSQYIIADIPDGIYELEAPAFYRPGGNGEGDWYGSDYIPADLFINDWYTPVMNIYAGRVLYQDAINGVNCRYDASGDENAPHNGESTSAQDFDTGDGYVPEQRQAVSFAFAGGRYINKVYGLVEGGELRIGIRNTGKPWYESGMTMWGKFKLTYQGQSAEAVEAMMENFQNRLDALKNAHDTQFIMFYSMSHVDKIDALIAQANAASGDEKMSLIRQINDEFNTILDSYDAYQELANLLEYCNNKADEYIESNPDLYDAFAQVAEEIEGHYIDGDLTDEQARNYREQILNNPALGGGYYVQGDLLDAEGGTLTYGTNSGLYPMRPQEDGTFVARGVRVQNRKNLANADARAGVYVSRMDERYECTLASRRFVTPYFNTHKMVLDDNTNHNDFQMVGGTYDITYSPADSTIRFELVGEYPWHDNVYVVGSIINAGGEQHRWKNDEMAPLAHQGGGLYSGTVTFYRDDKENMYPNFTIFSCRSNTGSIPHSSATRSGWNEGRYGSEENKLILENGVTVGDLIRNSDRKWYMNWDEENEAETQEYFITFDMNRGTVRVGMLPGDVNADGGVDIADAVSILNIMAEGTDNKVADVNKDGHVDIADFVSVLNIMAEQ